METNNTPEFVQDNYRDYNGSTFFAVNKCVNVRFVPVLLTRKSDGATIPCVKVTGLSNRTGEFLNFTLFPRFLGSAEDIERFKAGRIDDINFRVGFAKVIDPDTGDIQIVASKPKLLAYSVAGATYVLEGEDNSYAANMARANAAANALPEDPELSASTETPDETPEETEAPEEQDAL